MRSFTCLWKILFNQATVDIALQSLSHIREVVVVYVDTLQTPATPRKGKSASLSDTLTTGTTSS
jgi:hypothetical protein